MPKLGIEPVRRQQLIDATIASIHQDGFQDATVARISRRAGLSVGLVNHYFDGKTDLLEATMQMLVDQTLSDIESGMAAGTTARDKLIGFTAGNFAPGQRSPEAISAWLSFYAQVPEHDGFARIHRAFDRALFDLLQPVLADVMAPDQVDHAAHTLIALMYGLWLRHAHDSERIGLRLIHTIAREHVETLAPLDS
ncbi:MAG: transcriptional regulator BetI [Rhodospirillales bacterium]|nr:transcriptional regulator BetI [Rhodospirillales bacterium]